MDLDSLTRRDKLSQKDTAFDNQPMNRFPLAISAGSRQAVFPIQKHSRLNYRQTVSFKVLNCNIDFRIRIILIFFQQRIYIRI